MNSYTVSNWLVLSSTWVGFCFCCVFCQIGTEKYPLPYPVTCVYISFKETIAL